jgi:quercetin dioxygenase-like cupin family protein
VLPGRDIIFWSGVASYAATPQPSPYPLFAAALFAQNPGVTRNIVERADLSIPGREAVIARVEFAPGKAVGRHTHPGEEISEVIEEEGELLIDGQAPRKVKSDDRMIIPAGKIHDARNTGSGPMRIVAVYYIEKGKPLATPAK